MRLGITNCFSTLFKQKVNTVLNKYEDPNEALDYSYTRKVETLTRLRAQEYRRSTDETKYDESQKEWL